jgi:dUTPase.
MNITHATHEEIKGDMLTAIFDRQKELMSKYHDIEIKSGLCQTPDVPVNLNDKRGQARIKDFAWRVTEELGEALDSLVEDGPGPHYQEELVDALHFLTELTILSGNSANSIYKMIVEKVEPGDMLYQLFVEVGPVCDVSIELYYFIISIGMMCNTLKNKPWKQSQMITDEKEFNNRLRDTWNCFISILKSAGLDAEKTCDLYLRKSQVNKFRQRTNY